MKKYEFKVHQVMPESDLLETMNKQGAEGWFPVYVEIHGRKQERWYLVVFSREILPKGAGKKYESRIILIVGRSSEDACNHEGTEGWFPVIGYTKKGQCDFERYMMFWREVELG